ncbi:MAG: Flp pilus assembly protein CpaB [Paracoccaceae bacterium]
MGIRSILVAVIGVAVAGGSAWAARELLVAPAAEKAADSSSGMTTVVVAGRDIGFGQAIQAPMLQVIAWPRSALPPGAVTDLETLLPASGTAPRRATHSMAEGELVLASKISGFGEKVTLVQSLAPNTRAMAIKVDAETAVGGFVTPGDSVDIVMTQGRDQDLSAITILQDIRVVGVDQETDQTAEQPEVARTVTVEVTPEQGQKLALAQKAGALSLTLRTVDATNQPDLGKISLADLVPADPLPPPVVTVAAAEPAPEPAPAPRATIRVRRATQVEVETLN